MFVFFLRKTLNNFRNIYMSLSLISRIESYLLVDDVHKDRSRSVTVNDNSSVPNLNLYAVSNPRFVTDNVLIPTPVC